MNPAFGPKRANPNDDYAGDCWSLYGVDRHAFVSGFAKSAPVAVVVPVEVSDVSPEAEPVDRFGRRHYFDASWGE